MAIELRELRALDNWFVDLIELEGGRALILQPGVDQTYLVCIEGEESNPFWKLCFKHEWDAGALVKMNVPSIVQLDRQHLFLAAGPHRAIIDLSKGEILKHIKADRWPSGEAHRQQNSVLVPEGDRLGQYLSGDLLPTSQEVPNGHWILGQHPLRYSRIVVEDPDGLKEPWLWRPSDDEMLDLSKPCIRHRRQK